MQKYYAMNHVEGIIYFAYKLPMFGELNPSLFGCTRMTIYVAMNVNYNSFQYRTVTYDLEEIIVQIIIIQTDNLIRNKKYKSTM